MMHSVTTQLPHELYNLLVIFGVVAFLCWLARLGGAAGALAELRGAARRGNVMLVPGLGRGGALTYPRRPRPKGWCAGVELSAPRTAVGINEYLHVLSHREHGAVRRA